MRRCSGQSSPVVGSSSTSTSGCSASTAATARRWRAPLSSRNGSASRASSPTASSASVDPALDLRRRAGRGCAARRRPPPSRWRRRADGRDPGRRSPRAARCPRARSAAMSLAIEQHAAGGRSEQAVQVPGERRLAGAVAADERHQLADVRPRSSRRRAPRGRRRSGARHPPPAGSPDGVATAARREAAPARGLPRRRRAAASPASSGGSARPSAAKTRHTSCGRTPGLRARPRRRRARSPADRSPRRVRPGSRSR